MRRLFYFFLLLFAATVCIGFVRGWFTVDRARIAEDEKKAEAEVRLLMQKAKAKTANRDGDAGVKQPE